MWLKRMINQVIRGSFECYINARKDITELDHVAEVNENITNAESSINMNLWALKEEMGYNANVKEKINVEEVKRLVGKSKNLKNFIELPNQDHDIVVEKEVFEKLKNEPPREERNILVEEEQAIEGCRNGRVDDPQAALTDKDDSEAENEENDAVLVGDGNEKDTREYATNICIPPSRRI
jgi:hypothetical protein